MKLLAPRPTSFGFRFILLLDWSTTEARKLSFSFYWHLAGDGGGVCVGGMDSYLTMGICAKANVTMPV